MEFGLVLPNTGELANYEAVSTIAEKAESFGFAKLWVADHLVLPVESDTNSPYSKGLPNPNLPILDPMIVLAAVAARTQRIRLGVSVYLPTLRHPIVAAKLAASLDQISQGRLILGVGAGWIPGEYETMGVDFTKRGKVLDEHIAAMRVLFEHQRPHFEGQYYQFSNMGFEPKPVQSPLPIWIGGNSAAARRRTASLGDGWHVINVPASELKPGITDLQCRLEKNGRNPADVVISARTEIQISNSKVSPDAPLVGPITAILDELALLQTLGVKHVGLWPAAREKNLSLEAYLQRMQQYAEDVIKPFRER